MNTDTFSFHSQNNNCLQQTTVYFLFNIKRKMRKKSIHTLNYVHVIKLCIRFKYSMEINKNST